MRAQVRPAAERRDVLFTPDLADRALPYVRRVVEDLVRDHARWRAAVRESASAPSGVVAGVARRTAARLVTDVQRYLDELQLLGVVCREPEEGRVDFPAFVEGTAAWLCWEPGDAQVAWWRPRDADSASPRRPLPHVLTAARPGGTAPAVAAAGGEAS